MAREYPYPLTDNMQSFQSLLSSIGGGQPKAPQPKTPGASNTVSGTPGRTPGSTRQEITSPGVRLNPNNMVAGAKRKLDDQSGSSQPKTVRTEVKVPMRPSLQSGVKSGENPSPSATESSTAYRGTARPSGSPQLKRPVPKLAAARPVPAVTSSPVPAADSTSKPKRGFAAIMEKAKAAEEAAKAAGSSMIKHRPVEKMSKRDRERAQQAAAATAANGKAGVKGGRAVHLADRSRSGTPNDAKAVLQKKTPETAYKGTMKKPAKPASDFVYKGTMKNSAPGQQGVKPAVRKGEAQDKYGGYASWSDLSGAEDEEDDYDSDGSSMMEAGLDDVEAEETMALRAAKREDQEAQEEEERLRREKNERRKKLLALNKSAAAKRKY